MLLIATRNKHKFEEIKRFVPDGIQVVSLADLGINLEVEEDGESFVQNSIKKAVFYGNMTKMKVIADDSGLVIDALNGFPGVHSARFMKDYDYKEKMMVILKMMEKKEERFARFVCAATYYDPVGNIIICCEEKVEGTLAYEIRGSEGFGYDPIFIPNGYDKTFGEMGEEKHKISHRYKAFTKLFSLLRAIIFDK
ncbi:RdgB/HAM1 family non-canonical purine NTP pyrophosphatase [Pseudothermotoga thermarum]|uniref:dITP/XTP pyrophosphatase n=1 Tax=Pseudothermotoga thermarum DSM 5069 TaxID=688269 RepID=F7YVZ2_9THEM|nr:RdgB/HAM1 family non-canonical purine NTP pyrophosphatase [Pseudothermotoga thermarum]AEH51823.1 dITPase [Pseudothermotoga thermarum DSM 5069]